MPQEGPPMKRSSLRLAGAALAVSALALAGCGSEDGGGSETETATSGGADGESYSIGITQIVSHPALDAERDGFKAALADAGVEVAYDAQNAQNDQATATTITNSFAQDIIDHI